DPLLLDELQRRASSLGPLRPAELDRHRAQCQHIREGTARARNQVVEDWVLGWALLCALLSGYWLRDPEHKDKTFVQFALWLSREVFEVERSPQTLERRMHLAAAFTREEAEAWARKGVGSTVLSY